MKCGLLPICNEPMPLCPPQRLPGGSNELMDVKTLRDTNLKGVSKSADEGRPDRSVVSSNNLFKRVIISVCVS